MSFSTLPGFAVLVGLAALAAGLYWLQRLRVRHREVVVPTTLFWRAAVQETRARVLTRRFRHPLAYALLLGIASLLWLAFAEPAGSDGAEEGNTLFLLDASAGMAWGDRFERAKRTLLDQVGRLPAGQAEVIVCGGWPRTVLKREEHSILLERRLERVRPEACPSSLERVAAALPREATARIVVVGDGPLRKEALPAGCELLRPGAPGERPANGGVLALGVADAASGAWDRVDIYVDAPEGYTINLESLADVPALGQEVVVRLPAGDAITLDDEARFRLPRRSMVRVRPAPELEAVLRADPGVEIAEDGVQIELVDGIDVTFEAPAADLLDAPGTLIDFVDAERDDGDRPELILRVGERRRVLLGRELLTNRFNLTRTRAYPLLVASAVRWLAATRAYLPYAAAGDPIPGTSFVPPVAREYELQHASLLDPLTRTDARRDDGIDTVAGGFDAAAWLALLAFGLLVAEWYLHRTGRVP